MTRPKIQILGLTRWSYPGHLKGFRRLEDSLAEQRARLYAPARLDHRLFLLEHVLLPCLRGQSDPDFTHLFLMGDQLPDPWRSRVLELLKTVPQIVPVFRPEGGKPLDICREVMLEHIDPTCDVTAQHRLDDDDAVGLAFNEMTRDLFSDMAPFFDQDGRMALDYCRGFILRSSDETIEADPVSMRFWAPGMVIFQRRDSTDAVMDIHHLKVWHYMPTLTWNAQPMFIRGAHHDNDSHLPSFGRRTRSFDFDVPNPNRFMRNHFGINMRRLSRVWDARKDHFLSVATQAAE